MRRYSGGYRNVGRIGKTRERLAELITAAAKESKGAEYVCWPDDLTRNNPSYVNMAKDGVSWDGYVRKWGDLYKGFHVHSWTPMGELVKRGIVLLPDGELIPRDPDPPTPE